MLRRGTLELEGFFDEKLGAFVRLLALQRLLPDPELLLATFTPDLQGGRRVVARATYPLIRRRLAADCGIDERSVELAEYKCRAPPRRVCGDLCLVGWLASVRGELGSGDLSSTGDKRVGDRDPRLL
jgi:hypothetical protein